MPAGRAGEGAAAAPRAHPLERDYPPDRLGDDGPASSAVLEVERGHLRQRLRDEEDRVRARDDAHEVQVRLVPWPLAHGEPAARGGARPQRIMQFEKIGKKTAHIGKLVHVRVLYPSCAFIPGICIAGRGGRIRALRLLVWETGTNACTRAVRFSFRDCKLQIIGPKLI